MRGLVTVVALGLLFFSGCSFPVKDASAERVSYGGSLSEYTYELKDGRTVTCLQMVDGYAGGLSCDWAKAR